MRTALYTILTIAIAGIVGIGSNYLFNSPGYVSGNIPEVSIQGGVNDSEGEFKSPDTPSQESASVAQDQDDSALASTELEHQASEAGGAGENYALAQPNVDTAPLSTSLSGNGAGAVLQQEQISTTAVESTESVVEDDIEDKLYSAYDDVNPAPVRWVDARKLEKSSIVTRVVKQGDIVRPVASSPTDDDYDFPTVKLSEAADATDQVDSENAGLVNASDDNPETDLSIPEGDLPDRNSRRLIIQGDGPLLGQGSIVRLSWDMFSWSTGDLVETTKAIDQPLYYTIGGLDNQIQIPSYLEQSIVNRTAGSRIMVIFGRGMADLSGQFDQNDAYVLLVDINY